MVEGDVDSQIDNNYGFLQAITRIQNWPGGKDIPIVLILTKIDQNYHILTQHGGTRVFLEKYFSSLIKKTRHLKVCKISAISITDSKIKDSLCDLEIPLQYCLDRISAVEAKIDEISRSKRIKNYCLQLDKKEKTQNIISSIVWLIVWGILFVLLLNVVLKLLPSTVWINLWDNITGQ
jgi:transposase